MQNIEVELFFNAGDIDRQSNWLIYPASLDGPERREIFEIIADTYYEKYQNRMFSLFEEVEKEIKRKSSYPDPTKLKKTTEWHYAQLKTGAIVYRFAFDGRRESGSERMNHSIEGAFLKGINLERSRRRYLKEGIDIVKEIGSQLPNDIEKSLVAANFDIFKEMYREYEEKGMLSSLYNHFYIACWCHEISVTKSIQVRPLYELSPLSKFFK